MKNPIKKTNQNDLFYKEKKPEEEEEEEVEIIDQKSNENCSSSKCGGRIILKIFKY